MEHAPNLILALKDVAAASILGPSLVMMAIQEMGMDVVVVVI